MRLPGWEKSKEPLSWMLGAGIVVHAVVTQQVNEILLGVATLLLGIPGAIGIDNWLQGRREQQSDTQSRLPSSSSQQSSSSSAASGGDSST